MARIPGKMRRRQWVREGDLIIVWPWDFQDSKADVRHRYTKTQAMYLSRKGVLPDDVDMFGMGVSFDDDGEHDDLFSSGDLPQEAPEADEAAEGDLFADDESDDLFADDADDESDDLFADDADEEVVQVEEEPAVVEPVVEEDVDDDDDDDDVDALFA